MESKTPVDRLMSTKPALRQIVLEATERVPIFRKPIHNLWNLYDSIRFRYSAFRNQWRSDHATKIDPYQLYSVDASDVEHYCGFDSVTDTGRVVGGDWDMEGTEFDSSGLHRSFRSHFKGDVEWEDTVMHSQHAVKVRRGEHSRCRSIEELNKWFTQYDELFKSMEEGGYKTQKQLLQEGDDPMEERGISGIFPIFGSTVLEEIAASVGRQGKFYLVDGRHRLSIAKILDIEVPVRIVVRHKKWQRLRDEVAREIDEAVEEDMVETSEVRERVETRLNNKLQEIFLGSHHPDINVLFNRRIP